MDRLNRVANPTKRWKLTPMDLESRAKWVEYSQAKDEMFRHTDTEQSPWYVVVSDDKRRARLNVIRHLLNLIPWPCRRGSMTRTTCGPRWLSKRSSRTCIDLLGQQSNISHKTLLQLPKDKKSERVILDVLVELRLGQRDIAAGGLDIGVPEQLLDRAQRRPRLRAYANR